MPARHKLEARANLANCYQCFYNWNSSHVCGWIQEHTVCFTVSLWQRPRINVEGYIRQKKLLYNTIQTTIRAWNLVFCHAAAFAVACGPKGDAFWVIPVSNKSLVGLYLAWGPPILENNPCTHRRHSRRMGYTHTCMYLLKTRMNFVLMDGA